MKSMCRRDVYLGIVPGSPVPVVYPGMRGLGATTVTVSPGVSADTARMVIAGGVVAAALGLAFWALMRRNG